MCGNFNGNFYFMDADLGFMSWCQWCKQKVKVFVEELKQIYMDTDLPYKELMNWIKHEFHNWRYAEKFIDKELDRV